MRERDVDRGAQLDAFDRAQLRLLDLDFFVEMRLQRLAHETVEPHHAAVEVGIAAADPAAR